MWRIWSARKGLRAAAETKWDQLDGENCWWTVSCFILKLLFRIKRFLTVIANFFISFSPDHLFNPDSCDSQQVSDIWGPRQVRILMSERHKYHSKRYKRSYSDNQESMHTYRGERGCRWWGDWTRGWQSREAWWCSWFHLETQSGSWHWLRTLRGISRLEYHWFDFLSYFWYIYLSVKRLP